MTYEKRDGKAEKARFHADFRLGFIVIKIGVRD
jgi:hypothetical protein